MLFSPALLRCCCGAAAVLLRCCGVSGSDGSGRALRCSQHHSSEDFASGRKSISCQVERSEWRAIRRRRRRRRKGKPAPPPPPQPHPHPQVERCDRSCLEARRASGKRCTRRSF